MAALRGFTLRGAIRSRSFRRVWATPRKKNTERDSGRIHKRRPAMTVKDILLHHLEYTFEKEAWQPSLAMAIDGLTAKQAAWKPAPERHSIWQIVRHVAHWKQATLGAWDGTRPLFSPESGDTDYYREAERTDWRDVSGDEAAWWRGCDALRPGSSRVTARTGALAAGAFLEPVPGRDMPAVLRLLRLATPGTHHPRQNPYLRGAHGNCAGTR